MEAYNFYYSTFEELYSKNEIGSKIFILDINTHCIIVTKISTKQFNMDGRCRIRFDIPIHKDKKRKVSNYYLHNVQWEKFSLKHKFIKYSDISMYL